MKPEDFAFLPELFTFTVDVEPHREGATGVLRCEQATQAILDFLDEAGSDQRGTFFVLDGLARSAPQLVRAIAARGHEIGSHAVDHVPLERQERGQFGQAMQAARKRLEDLAQAPVQGFRAPYLSLTRKAAWVIPELVAAGFAYSSSLVPGRSPARSWPGAPVDPFRWPAGLLELPCPVGRVGRLPLWLPCLGGMNLRYVPGGRLRRMVPTIRSRAVWTYCHPYEFDLDEPYGRAPGAGPLASYLLWANRRTLIDRLRLFMRGRRSQSFMQRMPAILADLAPAPIS